MEVPEVQQVQLLPTREAELDAEDEYYWKNK
jgi:hypothetical protein